jgi:histidine kinase
MDNLHQVLKRQLHKCGFNDEDIKEERLISLITKINKSYEEYDNNRYLKDRAVEVSSLEMRDLYKTIQQEKINLQNTLNDLIAKDKMLNERNTELSNQRNYADSLVASIPDMLFIADQELNIIDINMITAQQLGLARDVIVGLNINSILVDIKPIQELVKSNIVLHRSKKLFANYSTELKKSTDNIPVLVSTSIRVDEENHSVGVICIVKDISELKRLETENTQKMALLAHAGRLTALGEMATGVAHELNQPLSIIRTNMQTLDIVPIEELPKEELKEIIVSTMRQVDRASAIINHMRSFARKQQIHCEPINIIPPIQAAIGMFDEQFRLHQIEINFDFDKDVPFLPIESQEVEQIIINLLSNAKHALEIMKFKVGNSFNMKISLNLSYKKASKEIILKVADNGVGMTADVREHCLEPFFTTKEVGEGTGLGLHIIYSIIKTLKGSIDIETAPDNGACFIITIPVGDA